MQLINVLNIENMFRIWTSIPSKIVTIWFGFVAVWIGRFLLTCVCCFMVGLIGLIIDTIKSLIKKYKLTHKTSSIRDK